jgi:zinc protease
VTLRRPGTAAYLKVAYHAPAAADPRFFPALVLDAALTGAKGVNLWSSFRTPPPQRKARLYRALVETGIATSLFGLFMPTQEPFLYTLSATATDGTPPAAVEQALLDAVDEVRLRGLTEEEVDRAKTQLKARFVFDRDSVTNIAHQLGYFETIGSASTYESLEESVDAVTVESVAEEARTLLHSDNRTVGWFQPLSDPAR